MTTLIIDGLNRDVLKKRSIVTLKWEDDPEKVRPIPACRRLPLRSPARVGTTRIARIEVQAKQLVIQLTREPSAVPHASLRRRETQFSRAETKTPKRPLQFNG
jgi:hypothetical protein